MAVTITNLIQGPARLLIGDVGATEPTYADSADGVGFTDLGGTQDGVTLTVDLTFAELSVDQLVDVPGQTLVKRMAKIATNLAEATLENWALALNDADPVSSAFEPTYGSGAFTPTYKALLLRGIGPNGGPRDVVLRRALQIGSPGSAYKKDGQTLIPVEFSAHYVSSVIAPFKINEALDPS